MRELNRIEQHVLDELCLHQDPLPWPHLANRLRAPAYQPALERAYAALLVCMQRGYACMAGVRVRRGASPSDQLAKDQVFTATADGRAHWEAHVRGLVARDQQITERYPISKYSIAMRAAASAARTVFELAEAPWRWARSEEDREADHLHALALAARRTAKKARLSGDLHWKR